MLLYFRLRKDYVRPILLTLNFKDPDKEELVCIDLSVLIQWTVKYLKSYDLIAVL